MKKGKFGKSALRLIAAFLILFTFSVLVVFWHTGNEPAILITSVFAAATAELTYLKKIKTEKEKTKRVESRRAQTQEKSKPPPETGDNNKTEG